VPARCRYFPASSPRSGRGPPGSAPASAAASAARPSAGKPAGSRAGKCQCRRRSGQELRDRRHLRQHRRQHLRDQDTGQHGHGRLGHAGFLREHGDFSQKNQSSPGNPASPGTTRAQAGGTRRTRRCYPSAITTRPQRDTKPRTPARPTPLTSTNTPGTQTIMILQAPCGPDQGTRQRSGANRQPRVAVPCGGPFSEVLLEGTDVAVS
jgi:hypothetical protein